MKSEQVLIRYSLLLITFLLKAKLARQKGLEPLTYCLEGSCSIQLSYWRISGVERVTGIGPAYPAWKAGVLPLNYTRKTVFLAVSYKIVTHLLPCVKVIF